MRQLVMQRVLLLALVAAVAGCASAGKRYEQGAELEAKGQYAAASERYIQALRKDRAHLESRERLSEVGPQAIAEYVALASTEGTAGNWTRAADHYLAVDRLLSDAAAVGVALEVREEHHFERRSAMQAAVDQLLQEGQAAEERQRFAEAMRSYDRADRYEPNGEQRSRLFDASVRTAVHWAEADLAARRYRSAVAHADHAVGLLGGPDRPEAQGAMEVRAAALEQGTIFVAMAPLWRSDEAAQFITDGFLSALNDDLELHAWTDPPMFVASVDPVAVRRELRRQRYSRSVLTPREAARVGRDLDADFLVTGEIGIFTLTEGDVRREVRKASTRSGVDTTYALETGTVTYRAEVTYLVMDVHRGREVRRSSVDVSESGDFERAVFSGNPSDLVLTRNERRRFDPERRRDAEQELEERVVARLSARLAEKVYRDLLRLVR